MKKVLLKSMLLFAAILFMGTSYAQTVSGTVMEESGPLPGANVVVKGTSNGATTDFDGNYTLNNVASDAVLVFSYVGYSTQEVPVDGRSTINVTLASDNALEEVVLIGYGQTRIKDATGAVAAVTAEDFNQGVITSPEQLIQGKTAGVQISESSGEPGAGIAIRIRGANSIRSGNDPLFVVDGVPLGGGGAPAGGAGGFGSAQRNPLSFLNPEDIESISILKDASATAIYGSRGANGVVIIQTKSGRGNSQGTWQLNTSVSSATPASEYNLLNAQQYLAALDEFGNDPVALNFGSDNDFQDAYTRNAFSRRTDLSYAKSYTGGNLRASFGYANQNGVIENTGQERITGRLNAQQRLFNDKLTLDLQGTISRVNDEQALFSGSVGSTGDLIGASITANPTWPLDPDFDPGSNLLNPVNLLRYYTAESRTNRYLANLSATYKILPELSAKVTGGIDYSDAETISVFAPGVAGINNVSNIGEGTYNTLDNTNSLLEATLTYSKDFSNSSIEVLGGYSYQKFDRNGIFATGRGFTGNNLDNLIGNMRDQYNNVANAINGDFVAFGYDVNDTAVIRFNPNNDGSIFSSEGIGNNFQRKTSAFVAGNFDNFDELQSYFVRANYTLADKYLFTATYRRDGSSKFGPNNRYGNFPSGAFAWKMHEEDFVGDAFSTLKLRLGAGLVGNQDGLDFNQFSRREVYAGLGFDGDGTLIDNLVATTLAGNDNPDLKWESTLDLSAGIDFGFNNDRLNGSLNFYRKETSDLLLRRNLAAPQAAIPTIFANLEDGVVINSGVELGLNYDFVDTEDIGFNVAFNIAYNDNVVEDLIFDIDAGPINGNGLTGAFAQRLSAGQPLFSYYMAVFTGFDGNGFPTYEDLNGDGVGDPSSDRKFVDKSALPTITSGLSLNFRYKRFSINTFFNGQFGQYVYNGTDNAFFTAGGITIGKNVTEAAINSGENGAATTAVSTRFLEKGDFIRMQNASISYNWPMSGDGLFDSLRLSLTGQNLFLITDYSGLDPEISVNTGSVNASNIPTAGIDYAAFPRARTFTLGVNATF
ncbi:MAG: SusC/RagA family TonB-linked outer membrane protein [Dokdonia sp.]|jgi:iron complex outermembrane receptor protein|nr:SusC/RagA family TonB-linked outer membrane protein [Cytophagaceae bacterium]